MTTINQVVTRLLFETNVERIEKINASIREYKKNLSDAKKELKDFNKTYKEQSKKLQQDLKSINREDFVSGETERLRHKLEKLELALGKTNRKRRKAKIEKEIGQTRTKLELSEGSDERKYEVSRKKAQKAIEDTTKQHEARKEKYEEEIEQTKENIETNKELSRKEKDNLNKTMVAFSRFTMAIGVATMAVKALGRAVKSFNDINMRYGSAGKGGNLDTLQLQSTAMALRGLGINISKKDLTTALGGADYTASLREIGQNMFSQHTMAGINLGDASDVNRYLARAYASYLSGTKENLLRASLQAEGLPAKEILASFDVAKNKKGITSADQFYNYLAQTRAGVSEKGNISNLGKSGILNRAVDTASGGFGQDMQEHPLQTLLSPIASYISHFVSGALGGNQGNINYNKNVTIHTNSPAVAREAIGEDLDPRIMQMNGGGH
jgi:hypothetical protein